MNSLILSFFFKQIYLKAGISNT